MNPLMIKKVKDIDWSSLVGSLNFKCPLKATVMVYDLSDPSVTPVSTEVTLIKLLDMREFLIAHYDWKWLDTKFSNDPDVMEEWKRFEYLWNLFVEHKEEAINRAVTAWMAKYRPGSAFYRREHGDSDKITYASTIVNNGGSKSSSYSVAGGSVSVSVGGADTDGYRAITPGDPSVSATALPTTTTSVTTYDSDTEEDTSQTENKGQNGSLNGSTNSSKTSRTGDDTHSKDIVNEGTEMGKGLAQAIQDEIGMRLNIDIGYALLDEFADRYLFGDGDDE